VIFVSNRYNEMFIEVVKSKIHKVTITGSNLNYVGSITIDEDIMDAANIIENEKVHVLNLNNGERLVTYVIKGRRGSGEVCLNGAAARKVIVGDVVIIMSYAMLDSVEARSFKPTIIFPDTKTNKLI
jgi:aspartate 1-decarboxylase